VKPPRWQAGTSVLAFLTLIAACGTQHAAAGATGPGSVSLTPPSEDQGGMVLAVATAGDTAGQGTPAAPTTARAGDPIRDALADAYKSFKSLKEGKNADYIPQLAKVDPTYWGLAVVTVEGAVYEIGNAREEFSIQSVSKPFTAARVIDSAGAETVHERIGVNATGQPFNSILAIALGKNMPADKDHVRPAGNPLVNAGAITTVDLLRPAAGMDKWATILGNLEAFAGRRLKVDEEVFRSESETNLNNRAIVNMLKNFEVIKGDPMQALDMYTRQCSVSVNARDLAVMGATLANGGRNPLTGAQVVAPATSAKVLSLLTTAGLYETTGEWMYRVGVPAKSGVGGGIVAIVPGRFGIATFSPPLDPAGNSVRGQRAIEAIVNRLGANLFASAPAARPRATGAEKVVPGRGVAPVAGGAPAAAPSSAAKPAVAPAPAATPAAFIPRGKL